MFGKLGDMAEMMKKARELQQNIGEAKEELAGREVKGRSDGGEVEFTITCDMTVRRVSIRQDCLDTGDPEILQTLVVAAANSAITGAKAQIQSRMTALTGGFNIPGLT